MLTRIDLRHFKCFDLLKLPLRRLTLLSGANASGKSSVLQALVLLQQTMSEHEWSDRLLLNGGAVRLGTVADVVDQRARRTCRIALCTDETEVRWEFAGEPDEMSMEVMRVWTEDEEWEPQPDGSWKRTGTPSRASEAPWYLYQLYPTKLGDETRYQSLLHGLAYLSAERAGPQETYPLEDIRFARGVGSSGEYAVSALYAGRDETVPAAGLLIENVPATRLRQVEARMGRFFPGCELDLQKIPHANAVTLGLRTSNDVNFHAPVHTGYGLTQVLPIIVAALSATPNDLLLIENPEVHLHPVGQAAMGEFLAQVAAAGVQVIMETHSDHVLNGVRRAVKKGLLAPADAALHFFRPRQQSEQERLPQVHSPVLDSEGNVDTWPDGFFDQFDKDMNYFAGWG